MATAVETPVRQPDPRQVTCSYRTAGLPCRTGDHSLRRWIGHQGLESTTRQRRDRVASVPTPHPHDPGRGLDLPVSLHRLGQGNHPQPGWRNRAPGGARFGRRRAGRGRRDSLSCERSGTQRRLSHGRGLGRIARRRPRSRVMLAPASRKHARQQDCDERESPSRSQHLHVSRADVQVARSDNRQAARMFLGRGGRTPASASSRHKQTSSAAS